MNIDKLKKEIKKNPFASLNKLIYNFLFENIINLSILPGTKINESNLAKNLNISRSPIQIAINKLCDDQLIIKNKNKKIVSSITSDDFLKITQARSFIEGSASYLSAKVISTDDLEFLKKCAAEFEEIVKDESLNNFETCDHNFHTTIVNACDNEYLIEMYNSVKYQILRYRYSLRHKVEREILRNLLQNTVKSHWTLYHSLKMGYSNTVKDEAMYHSDAMRDAFINWR